MADPVQQTTRWEYVVDAIPKQDAMAPFNAASRADERGENGWELVSVLSEGGHFLLWFKRTKEAIDGKQS